MVVGSLPRRTSSSFSPVSTEKTRIKVPFSLAVARCVLGSAK